MIDFNHKNNNNGSCVQMNMFNKLTHFGRIPIMVTQTQRNFVSNFIEFKQQNIIHSLPKGHR